MRKGTLFVHEDAPSIYKDTIPSEHAINYEEYRLQIGDILNLNVVSSMPEKYDLFTKMNQASSTGESLNPGFVINPSGKVDLPIVGELYVAGKTLMEAEQQVQDSLDKIYSQSVVRLSLKSYKVSLTGEVNGPGVYRGTRMRTSIMEIISMGGGFTEFSDASKVKVIRSYNLDTTEVFYLDLTDRETLSSSNIYIKPNDIIVVNAQRAKKYEKFTDPFTAIRLLTTVITIFALIRSF